MFGLSVSEVVLCLLVALIVFGPKRLPEIAHKMGKTMGELRRALDELKYELTSAQHEIKNDMTKEPRLVSSGNLPEIREQQEEQTLITRPSETSLLEQLSSDALTPLDKTSSEGPTNNHGQ